MTSHDEPVALSAPVRELARAVTVDGGAPYLPPEAMARFAEATLRLQPEQRERLAEECLALLVRVVRETDTAAAVLVAQLYGLVAMILADLDRADDLFAAAGIDSARERLLGTAGINGSTFEEKDAESKGGVLNLLSTKK